jgi:hypothetical protein
VNTVKSHESSKLNMNSIFKIPANVLEELNRSESCDAEKEKMK